LLTSPQLIDKIIQSQIAHAWIDTSKGLDIEEFDVSPDSGLNSAPESSEASLIIIPSAAERVALNSIKSLTMDQEMGRAANIVGKTKQAVCSMFNEARMGNAVDTAQAMLLVEEIAESVMRNPGALIGLARLKTADDYTYMHSVAVCALMIALANQLGLSDDETREAGLAGLLHDIGKMAIDSAILNKPGKLTDDEFTAVKLHPSEGHSMLLESSGVSAMALDVCLHHHEKTDGSGYPFGLTGDQISLYAKMGAVCDVYDAITSNRPYKAGWCPAESLKKCQSGVRGILICRYFRRL